MPATPTIDAVIARSDVINGQAAKASLLSGGHVNRVYLVENGPAKCVVHIPERTDDGLVPDRMNERHNSIAAAETGIAPRVLEMMDEWGVMIVEYVEGEPLTDTTIGGPHQIPRIATALRTLHAGRRFRLHFDMAEQTRRWLGICDRHAIATPDGLRDRMGLVHRASAALAVRPPASVPSHNDLSSDNFIDDGSRLWIIDFEYSGNNDPCYDVGDVANQAGLDPDYRARLCEAYFGSAEPTLLARMDLHSTIASVGWAVWSSIQAELSTLDVDFRGYARFFFDQALASLESNAFERNVRRVSRG